ncbi:MAG: hypothetical protein ACRD8W_07805 [Nitrososphaeraceae archaeon]
MSTTNGISKKTFECFVCQKQGFSNERVYLAGNDCNGIYRSHNDGSRLTQDILKGIYNVLSIVHIKWFHRDRKMDIS